MEVEEVGVVVEEGEVVALVNDQRVNEYIFKSDRQFNLCNNFGNKDNL